MRDLAVIENELAEISAIQDDITRLERIIAWSAVHPDEVPLALRFFRGRSEGLEEWLHRHGRNQ